MYNMKTRMQSSGAPWTYYSNFNLESNTAVGDPGQTWASSNAKDCAGFALDNLGRAHSCKSFAPDTGAAWKWEIYVSAANANGEGPWNSV